MKKKLIIILGIFIIGIFIVINGINKKLDINNFQKIQGIFNYNEEENNYNFNSQDIEQIYKIFEGKKLYSDNPSCGFSENVSIVVDDSYCFYFALDGCPIIYFKNENKYFKLSDSEKETLFNILEKYNFKFPCV